jgi:glycosyltransferase involved in cell wall biosynthesis
VTTTIGADLAGSLVVDASALQSPATRRRGIGRYALNWCRALDSEQPGLIGRFLLDPDLPPLPGEADDLVASGRVRYRDAPDAFPRAARVLHTFALLDLTVQLEQSWPNHRDGGRLLHSVTVFDCIPALDPAGELADPLDRRRYLARFDLLRAAEQLQVLSSSVAADLQRLLGVPAERIALVGCAPDSSFGPPSSRQEVRHAAIEATPELDRPYVLYPSGSHPRKNNEALVRAWARLPQRLIDSTQLVITGDMPHEMRRHYQLLAERLGTRGGLVLPGDVDDDVFLHLVQGAALVCFPSLAEGYGLPIAEALACHTPVISSNRPPLDELLPPEARFDPTSPAAIAVAITRALARPETDPAGEDEHSGERLLSWGEVGRLSATTLLRLVSATAADRPAGTGKASTERRGRRRRRLAVVTPLPPAHSGVAAYSYRLIEELDSTGSVQLDLFADGPTPGQYGPEGMRVEPVGSLGTLEALAGHYDHVLYMIGNSHHHLGALAALRRRPGVVICHDVWLGNLYVAEHGDLPQHYRSLPRAVQGIYGPGVSDEVGLGNLFSDGQRRRFGVQLAREVIESSERYLVSSRAARDLALSDVPGRFAQRIAVLPFALEAPPLPSGSGETSAGQSDTLHDLGDAPLIAHFGIVDPTKQPLLVIDAFAGVRREVPDAKLAFVGPASESLTEELRERCEEQGLEDSVILTGAVPATDYRAVVERATVAVQLRSRFNGEASAAVGQCLACGVPTIVSDLGWMGELPEAAVVKVPRDVSCESLARTVLDLVAEPARRASLTWAALEVTRHQGFDVTAHALLEVIEQLEPDRLAI